MKISKTFHDSYIIAGLLVTCQTTQNIGIVTEKTSGMKKQVENKDHMAQTLKTSSEPHDRYFSHILQKLKMKNSWPMTGQEFQIT